jgi:hypothetical protein
VARQIEASLKKAGGDALEQAVYDTKVKNGETTLTHIHHRQTPLYLMQGVAQAGVTWKSEAIFQEQAGPPHQQRAHSRRSKHHGDIRCRSGQGRRAPESGSDVGGIPALPHGTENF